MKAQELEKWRQNPIVQIFRESDLSLLKTQELIGKRWKVPPEGFPMDRIYSVCEPYLQYLVSYAKYKVHQRIKSNTPISYRFLKGKFELTKREYNYIMIRI